MYHRLILPVVLSLLLLVSQQLGFAHAISHLSGEGGRTATSEERGIPGAPKVLADGSCLHCPAYAQLAFALTSSVRSAPDLKLSYAPPAVAPLRARGIAAPAYFQPRAPPRA